MLDIDESVFSPPELGCVFYLPGLPGSGSKIYDRSPYANIGTITGATWKRLPSGLWYLSFDGVDDDVNLGSSIAYDFERTDRFSILFWAKTSTAPQNTGLISKQHRTTYEGYHVIQQSSEFRFHLRDTATPTNNSFTVGISETPYVDGNWHFFAFRYNGSSDETGATIHVDLVEPTRVVTAGTLTDTIIHADPLEIGQRGTFGHWEGEMALLRIKKELVSLLEMQNLLNREKHLFGA